MKLLIKSNQFQTEIDYDYSIEEIQTAIVHLSASEQNTFWEMWNGNNVSRVNAINMIYNWLTIETEHTYQEVKV